MAFQMQAGSDAVDLDHVEHALAAQQFAEGVDWYARPLGELRLCEGPLPSQLSAELGRHRLVEAVADVLPVANHAS